MSDELKNLLLQSNKVNDSEMWDAEYHGMARWSVYSGGRDKAAYRHKWHVYL